MNPILFEIGPFALGWYGVFIVGGAVLAAYLASRYAMRAGENPDHIWNLLAWVLVFGIVGARAYHVFSSPAGGVGWSYYRQYPLAVINFWNGGFRGLGIYGGLAGGVIAVFVYAWRHKLNPVQYLDFMAPTVLLAQAIGRMGNFVNQELYGPLARVPWAFHVNPRYPCAVPPNLPQGIQPCGVADLTKETVAWYASRGFHPTFFYEAGWNLLMFGLLALVIWRFGDKLRRGDAVLLYIIAYSAGRYWVELFRPDAWTIGSLATAQWIALASVTLATLVLIWRHLGWRSGDHPLEALYQS